MLSSLVLCLLAPIMEIGVFNALPSLTEIKFQSNEGALISEPILRGTPIETIQKVDHTSEHLSISLYLFITFIFLTRYGLNLFRILKLTRKSSEYIEGLKLVKIEELQTASSFFNYLFIDPKHLMETSYAKSVLQHEVIHSKHWHSLDILLVELLNCVFWFNPFVWLYKRQIRENHEFIADEQVIKSGMDISEYSNSIIYSGNTLAAMPFTSGFNFNHIKNRLIMLQQSRSSVLKRSLKSLLAFTLFAAIFTLSSFKDSKPQLVVVIDAGHGGKDSGNLIEKDVVLQISNKLARYSDHKIKIVETRSADEFLSLSERVNFINQLHPDLVISLHCNASQNTDANGVEAFYYDKNEHRQTSHDYSRILVENQLDQFNDRGELKAAGFYILKNVDVPALVLELGFISNAKDKAILTNDNHQETIAKSLHESLLKIREFKNN
ncbi:M56/M15 family metallopeptidase [Gelidibacter mesophilus]|uniref:M56/M15 family metallopeptidase n=1 Tax=Gelidibacter mesophilus TaxID=169050 RepID=UPI001B7FA496|nr:M56/M15 family metallopeptidase [Gelidibacter mesophilus]